ncbi:MAG TPA: tail protein X [Candidatus Sulfotelmatobacter sp.]|jgi:phage tail protein X|nr:tail protein X [Candidatus Sulfotelmatobacter sp.]
MASVILARQGDTADIIAARCYDGDTSMATAILAANHGLAALGIFIPHGTIVTLPDRQTSTVSATVSLWD